MKKKLMCPNCRREQLARIARRGFLREKFFPLFGYYPWECGMCRRQVLLRKRGAAYRKSRRQSSPIQDHATPAPNQ